LCSGGTAILAESALHVSDLAAANDVTLISMGSTTMAELLRVNGIPPSVRTVNLGGEPTPGALVRQLYESTPVRKVFNPYGPTECTSYSTFSLLTNDSGPPSIGRPIANTTTYILDEHGALVPVGLPGELHIGGAGVARGYLNNPELTAEKFAPNPFVKTEAAGGSGTRMFRSGDLARFLPDGRIEFLGRLDYQVKIRGFRVEPEEVEAALRGHPAIRDVVVAASRGASGDQRLVAFIVPEGERAPTPAAVRTYLKGRLPLHMVPSAVVSLQALPVLPNGKVNRAALGQPEEDRTVPEAMYVGPRTAAERTIAGVWEEVLQRPRVGVEDNFFDLGGHSLLMLRVYSKLREVFSRNIQMVDLFEYPTVASLAAYLVQEDTRESPVRRGDRRAEFRRKAAARRQAGQSSTSPIQARASADEP
jgi:acyl-CoA synthetase (AMP-forming)/AMP-acid ligase II/acyl carrier protein